jgi:hypothetical protein
VLILFDLWGVDKRYINNDKFKPERQMRPFTESIADKEILKDKDPFYRVFNINNPFNEVNTSYYHKSIGGYHGAKLQTYQDIIDNHLQPNCQYIRTMLQQGITPFEMDYMISNMPVLNMLNTKYIIYDPNSAPFLNPHAMGNAWFVQNMQTVPGLREEIDALNDIDIQNTAVVHTNFVDILGNATIGDEGGTIELTEYRPDKTVYKAKVGSPQIAIFSEIYYPEGWEAYINGNKTSIFRANYILRGLSIPEGESVIEFRFKSEFYYMGIIIAGFGSVLILVLAGFLIFMNNNKEKIS